MIISARRRHRKGQQRGYASNGAKTRRGVNGAARRAMKQRQRKIADWLTNGVVGRAVWRWK
jgi:hypothetical protein